jgi:hypothetical protein
MATDEIDELGKAARDAFRAYYGKDDPIAFTELTPLERKRFEAIAEIFLGPRGRLEADAEKVAEDIRSATQEGIAAAIATRREWPLMSGAELFGLLMRSTDECVQRYIRKEI